MPKALTISHRPPEPRVLGVGGSPRKDGNSDLLLDYILNGVRSRQVDAEAVFLRDVNYQPCLGCELCRTDKICSGLDDGMSILYPKINGARGLVLVSPTHHYNVTAWVKAFIDRLYCFYDFDDRRPRGWSSRLAGQGRRAVLAAVCEQTDQQDMGFTLDAMRRPLEALGYDIVGELPVFGLFDRGKVRDHREILSAAEHLGRDLAESMLGLHSAGA